MLANATVVILLQFVSVSNRHDVHLKLTQCDMSVISHNAGEGKGNACSRLFQCITDPPSQEAAGQADDYYLHQPSVLRTRPDS